jgi:hypothetical protein
MQEKLFFYVDNKNKNILDIPKKLNNSWKGIIGLNFLSDEELIDLEWSGHPDFGFIPWNVEYTNLLKNYKCTDKIFLLFKNFIKECIFNLRQEVENGGVEVDGKYFISTDDSSKLLLHTMYFNIINNSEKIEDEFKFKTANGIVKFTQKEFKSLFNSINFFIKNCLEKEIELIDIIDEKNSFLELIEIDFYNSFNVSNKIKL